jgi:hypothetical protein
MTNGSALPQYSAQRLQSGVSLRGCSHSIIFRPPSLLATQVVPTAEHPVWISGRPWRLHPSKSRFVASPRIGYASRPNRAIDGRGLSPPRSAALLAATGHVRAFNGCAWPDPSCSLIPQRADRFDAARNTFQVVPVSAVSICSNVRVGSSTLFDYLVGFQQHIVWRQERRSYRLRACLQPLRDPAASHQRPSGDRNTPAATKTASTVPLFSSQ